MAYKTSFILSLIFVIQLLLLIGDLLMIQVAHARLDAIGLAASALISRQGGINEEIVSFTEQQSTTLTCLSMCSPRLGDVLTFRLEKTIDPFIISEDTIQLSVIYHAVIGFYA
jgi:hypothetical protein